MLRLQVQHPIVSVAKNLVGVTDVKIDVAEMRAHGDTRLAMVSLMVTGLLGRLLTTSASLER